MARKIAQALSATLLAAVLLAGVPAHAQSWNVYQNYTTSFFVPFVGGSDPADTKRTVNLTLSFGDTTKTTPFIMDTGSTGIAAGPNAFKPTPGKDTFLGTSSLTYTSSNLIETGNMWLTDVVIHGTGSNTITARVPILNALTECPTTNPNCGKPSAVTYMGIGFDRGGGVPATTNTNPFLALTSSNVAGVDPKDMRAGYIITNSNTPNGVPGVTLGLTNSNTSGFTSFLKLPANGTSTPGCTAPVPGCVYNSGSAIATVSVNNQNVVTNGQILPDSGIVYMILQTPAADSLPKAASCAVGSGGSCLANGAVVKVTVPGLSYQFTVGANTGNPNQPSAVEYFKNPDQSVNAGVGFYGAIDYLYDAAGSYTGYRWNGVPGADVKVVPVLALQGNVAFDSGFMTDFPVQLMPGTTTLSGPSTGSPGIFSSNLSGPGALAVNSGNYWLMGSTNTYSGGTTVNGGSLTLGPGATLPFGGALAIAGGTFNLNGNTQVLGSLNGGGGTLAMGGGMLVLNTTTANTLASSITGAGMLIVQGGGSLNLTGNNSSFTGSTAVSNASLAVNGSHGGNVAVGGGGVISGTGTIGGNLANAGTVAPGNSIGTLSVTGSYFNSSTGIYSAEVNSSQSDLLRVSGAAALQGGSVVVSVVPGSTLAPSTTYRLLTAAGGLAGTFASVNELYPFLQSSLSYDANNVYLTLQPGGFAAAAQTRTQYTVGTVLDANVNSSNSDFATIIGTLASLQSSQVLPFMTSISGQNYSAFSSSMVQGAALFMNNFANQTGGGGSPVSSRVALAEACEVEACQTAAPLWGAWGGALGGLGVIGANAATGAVTYNAGGFAAGLDRLVASGVRVGVTTGYTTGTQWTSGFSGNGTTDTFLAGLYGNYREGKVYADAVAGYAHSYNQMWRQISIPTMQQRLAQGRTGANQFYGQVEGGYRFDIGPVGAALADAYITPFARLQGYTGTQNGFTETGAQSLNLTVAGQTTNSLRSVIGAQLGGAIDLGWREKLALQFRLGWSHEYANTARPVTATLGGAPLVPFTTYGIAPQRDGVVLGFSANTAIAEATSLYLRYEGNVSGQDSAHALTAGVRMSW